MWATDIPGIGSETKGLELGSDLTEQDKGNSRQYGS